MARNDLPTRLSRIFIFLAVGQEWVKRGIQLGGHEMEINDPASKVSLILISISWCDVYLTIPRCCCVRSFKHSPVSQSEIPLAKMFYSKTPAGLFSTNLLPVFMPLKMRRAQVAATAQICIQSPFILGEREHSERTKIFKGEWNKKDMSIFFIFKKWKFGKKEIRITLRRDIFVR